YLDSLFFVLETQRFDDTFPVSGERHFLNHLWRNEHPRSDPVDSTCGLYLQEAATIRFFLAAQPCQLAIDRILGYSRDLEYVLPLFNDFLPHKDHGVTNKNFGIKG